MRPPQVSPSTQRGMWLPNVEMFGCGAAGPKSLRGGGQGDKNQPHGTMKVGSVCQDPGNIFPNKSEVPDVPSEERPLPALPLPCLLQGQGRASQTQQGFGQKPAFPNFPPHTGLGEEGGCTVCTSPGPVLLLCVGEGPAGPPSSLSSSSSSLERHPISEGGHLPAARTSESLCPEPLPAGHRSWPLSLPLRERFPS